MINKHELLKEQVMHAINHGEFAPDVVSSKDKVVVVMTQNWCPQWADMNRWIYTLDIPADIDIYELIYNEVDYFEEFMAYKENGWKNGRIPYLRFYEGGKLVREANYLNMQDFKQILGV